MGKNRFFDDAYPEVEEIGVWPVRGTTKDLIAAADEYSTVIVAIGDNQIRLQKSKFLLSEGLKLGSLIHPRAQVSKYAKIKEGSVVMAGAVINTSCSIDHDCVIGSGVHISPGAHLAGGVEVGDFSWLGVGSAVKQSIKIGCSATVAAGAVVVNDVPDGVVVKGVPAK